MSKAMSRREFSFLYMLWKHYETHPKIVILSVIVPIIIRSAISIRDSFQYRNDTFVDYLFV